MDVANKVQFLPDIIDLKGKGDRVQHLVGLGVPSVEPHITVHIPVIGPVGVVNREYRRCHQSGRDHTVAAVLAIGVHIIGL